MGHCCQKMKRHEVEEEGGGKERSKGSSVAEGVEEDVKNGNYKQKGKNYVSPDEANGKKPPGKRKNGTAAKYEINDDEIGPNERSVDLPSSVQIRNSNKKKAAQDKLKDEFEEIDLNERSPGENIQEYEQETKVQNTKDTTKGKVSKEEICHDNAGFEVEEEVTKAAKILKELAEDEKAIDASLNVEKYLLTPKSEAKRLQQLQQEGASDDDSIDINETETVVKGKSQQKTEQKEEYDTKLNVSNTDELAYTDISNIKEHAEEVNEPEIVPIKVQKASVGITNAAFEDDIDTENGIDRNMPMFMKIEGAHEEESFTDADHITKDVPQKKVKEEGLVKMQDKHEIIKGNDRGDAMLELQVKREIIKENDGKDTMIEMKVNHETIEEKDLEVKHKTMTQKEESSEETDYSSESDESFNAREYVKPKEDLTKEKEEFRREREEFTNTEKRQINIAEPENVEQKNSPEIIVQSFNTEMKVSRENTDNNEINLLESLTEKSAKVDETKHSGTIELGDIIVSEVPDSDSDSDQNMIPKQTVVIPIEEKLHRPLGSSSNDDQSFEAGYDITTNMPGQEVMVNKSSPLDTRNSYGEQDYLLESMTLPMVSTIDRGSPDRVTNQQQNVLSALDAALAERDIRDSDEEIEMSNTSKSYGEAEYLSESLSMTVGHINVQNQGYLDKVGQKEQNDTPDDINLEFNGKSDIDERVKHIMTKYGGAEKQKSEIKFEETSKSYGEADNCQESLTLSLGQVEDVSQINTKVQPNPVLNTLNDENEQTNNTLKEIESMANDANLENVSYEAENNYQKFPQGFIVSQHEPKTIETSPERVGSPELLSSGEMSRFKWSASPRSDEEDTPKVKKPVDLTKLKLKSISLSESATKPDVEPTSKPTSEEIYKTSQQKGLRTGDHSKSLQGLKGKFSTKRTGSPVKNFSELDHSSEPEIRGSEPLSSESSKTIRADYIVGQKSVEQASSVTGDLNPLAAASHLPHMSENDNNPWGEFTTEKESVVQKDHQNADRASTDDSIINPKTHQRSDNDPFNIKITEKTTKNREFGYPVNASHVSVSNNIENVSLGQSESNVQISMPCEKRVLTSDTSVVKEQNNKPEVISCRDSSSIAHFVGSSNNVLADSETTGGVQISMPSHEEENIRTDKGIIDISAAKERPNYENVHLEFSDIKVNENVSSGNIFAVGRASSNDKTSSEYNFDYNKQRDRPHLERYYSESSSEDEIDSGIQQKLFDAKRNKSLSLENVFSATRPSLSEKIPDDRKPTRQKQQYKRPKVANKEIGSSSEDDIDNSIQQQLTDSKGHLNKSVSLENVFSASNVSLNEKLPKVDNKTDTSKQEEIHKLPKDNESSSEDEFDSGIQRKLMDAKVHSKLNVSGEPSQELPKREPKDAATGTSMSKISPGVFKINLNQGEAAKPSDAKMKETDQISVQQRVSFLH